MIIQRSSRCVAEFQRLAEEGYGGDSKVRIYKADNGFVPCFYTNGEYMFAGAAFDSYQSAVNVAIEWIDNGEWHQ